MSTTGKILIVYNLLWCFHEFPLQNIWNSPTAIWILLTVSLKCPKRVLLTEDPIYLLRAFPSSINTSLEREGLPSGDEEEGDSVSHWHAQWDCWIRREQWDPPSGTPSIIIIIPGLVGAQVCSSELKSRQTSQNVTVNVTYMGLVDIKGF